MLTTTMMVLSASLAAFAGDPCSPSLPYPLPDLDQVRAADLNHGVQGLPNDGLMYCFPTGALNIMTYLTNHGYPQLAPGPGPWFGSVPLNNDATTAIELMGILMDTDPFDGTHGGSGTGIASWIESSGLTGEIVTTTKYVTLADAPMIEDVALALLAGCPTNLSVGWYLNDPQLLGAIRRDGGHCVTVTGVPGMCGPTQFVSIHDPGTSTGSSNTTQAAATTETYQIFTVANSIVINSAYDILHQGPLERMLGYGSASHPGYIDGIRAFIPKSGLAACNNPSGGVCVGQYLPHPTFQGPPQNTDFNIPIGVSLLDLDIHANNLEAFAVVSGAGGSPNTVWRVNTVSGAVTPVSIPMSPKRIATGRNWSRLYAVSQDGVVILNASLPGGGASGGGSTTVSSPYPLAAICFDERRNELVGLSAVAHRIVRLDPNTLAVRSDLPVPTGVNIGPDPRITICPRGAYIWLASGNSFLYGLMLNSSSSAYGVAATINAAPAVVEGVDADDRGHVFALIGGNLAEYAPPAGSGPWTRVDPTSWDGFEPSGSFFRLTRNRSNFDATIHATAEWNHNALPDSFAASVPDCDVDFNLSGGTDVGDIFAMLAKWFAQDPRADWNHDGRFTVPDIFAYLAAWFAGC